MINQDVKKILEMAHSPLHNYVVPGLTSYLLGSPSPAGTTRLFVNSRDQHHHITPHSHRFDFQCLVLRGWVKNQVFERACDDEAGDRYQASVVRYMGSAGSYTEKDRDSIEHWTHEDTVFRTGEWYGMTYDQVHSIVFSRDAVVLFLEGPEKTDASLILEPWVTDGVVETMRVEPWMFRRAK